MLCVDTHTRMYILTRDTFQLSLGRANAHSSPRAAERVLGRSQPGVFSICKVTLEGAFLFLGDSQQPLHLAPK